MSFGSGAALQAAVYALLTAHPGLAGVPVVDALPTRSGGGTFVLIGPDAVTDQSDASGGGAEHRFTVSVISDDTGFLPAKTAAVAVSDALDGARPALTRGRVVSLHFVKSQARRLREGGARRVDLTFRARIEL